MNRKNRRAVRSVRSVAAKGDGTPTNAIMGHLTSKMAERWPALRVDIEHRVGGPVKPGHLIDVQMTESAAMEHALRAMKLQEALDHAVNVLVLARAIAYSQGKLDEPVTTPS